MILAAHLSFQQKSYRHCGGRARHRQYFEISAHIPRTSIAAIRSDLVAVFVALLAFAGRLAWRIRSLRQEASAAIDHYGAYAAPREK